MRHREISTRAIANAMLAGVWSSEGLRESVVAALGACPPPMLRAIPLLLKVFPTAPLDRRDALARRLVEDITNPDDDFESQYPDPPIVDHIHVRRWLLYQPAMGEQRWPVPPIATVGYLGNWLGADGTALEWLADPIGLERFATDERLCNYRYRWMAKRRGGWRLIETPKAQLKSMQRRILHRILDAIPPHDAAHGFRHGRSVASFARPHAGRQLVLRLDLQDFFTTVTRARVFGIFRSAGYPEAVARVLSAMCTNRAPRSVCDAVPIDSVARRRLQTPHLPQGAPTSPALANLSAYGLDVRLAALATSAGARYTRYADDLAFSFDDPPAGERFLRHACQVAIEEGFAVNFRKLRQLTQAGRQQLGGVVVNSHPNVPRPQFDRLKAILHNCSTKGPSTQNREGSTHFRESLLGQISWVSMLDAHRGAKLRSAFEQIDWNR